MHILLGLITLVTALAWAIYALRQAGIHPSSFNPFAFARRMAWKRRYGQNPLYQLKTPEEAVAVILLAMAKCSGEVTREHKTQIIKCLEKNMQIHPQIAADLSVLAAHLLRDESLDARKISKIFVHIRPTLTEEQKQSILQMMADIGNIEPPLTEAHHELLQATIRVLNA